MTGQKPRQIAARILRQHRGGGDFIETIADRTLAEAGLSGPDRNLCLELAYGAVRWRDTLAWLVEQKTPGRTQKPALLDILALGLYQIFWLDRIPGHAAVHETVELAKHSGFGPQAGFVNALLRGYLREADATRAQLADLKKSRPALGFSHPEWLVDRWTRRWGADKTAALLEWNNSPPKTFARINSLAFQPDSASAAPGSVAPRPFADFPLRNAGDVLARWRDEKVDYDFFRRDWFEENLVFELKSHPPLARLASFEQGAFYIQDPSTLLAIHELRPAPGLDVLDLCAAPGGKTTFLAQRMENSGRIVATDASPDRLNRVRENCDRLRVRCVETSPADAAFRPGQFDRALVDAPCSNTGVLRRRVDLRWRLQPSEIDRLKNDQLQLLHRAAPLLKPGGFLVYSTCSIEPGENQDVVQSFLNQTPGFTLESQRDLHPAADHVDGAYVARLKRVG
ncbi:MAG: 16S rRNA (cytosine(967)-C(5))-methyltransferase RsmB [Verrucomicrobiota bacterium]